MLTSIDVKFIFGSVRLAPPTTPIFGFSLGHKRSDDSAYDSDSDSDSDSVASENQP